MLKRILNNYILLLQLSLLEYIISIKINKTKTGGNNMKIKVNDVERVGNGMFRVDPINKEKTIQFIKKYAFAGDYKIIGNNIVIKEYILHLLKF